MKRSGAGAVRRADGRPRLQQRGQAVDAAGLNGGVESGRAAGAPGGGEDGRQGRAARCCLLLQREEDRL